MAIQETSMFRELMKTNPLKGRLLIEEARKSEKLADVLRKDMTSEFYQTLELKVKNLEQIIIEIMGEVRSSKSTMAISLAKFIERCWNHYHPHRKIEFTHKHIYTDQAKWLYDVKNAKEGEVFIVDEQRSEAYGQGKIRESEQLTDVLNICAKRCNSIFFIQPRKFMDRNGIWGINVLVKVKSRGISLGLLSDLTKQYYSYPEGYLEIPKYKEESYMNAPKSKWSDYRKENYEKRGKEFDFWSLLEENYEFEKDKHIKDVQKLKETVTYTQVEKVAKELAKDPKFQDCRNAQEKRFYLMHKIGKGKVMGLTNEEMDLVIAGIALYSDGIV